VSREIAHGGRLAEARALFPGAPQPIIDLSTGINPNAYPLPDLPAEAWTRLPEADDVAALEAVAATAYGARPGQVVAAPGTQVLISLLPRIVPLDSVAVVGPTYAEHAASWQAAGTRVVEVGSIEDAAGHNAIVVCNPNNPDGRRTDPEALRTLARDLAARNGLLVVDEAFADLEDGPLSLIPDLPEEGVVVLRSFGKTYGLAGLRLGFAVAGQALVARIRAALGPWAVSGPAIAVGRRALADTRWLEQPRQRLEADSRRLDEVLTEFGMEVVGGTRLFRLAESNVADVTFDQLGRAGLYVRRFADRPGLLRFGILGDEAAWDRLTAALG
jgi:cobalamin biosynthetic protein CobC